MKKLLIILMAALILIPCLPGICQAATDQDLQIAKRNLRILSNALELYANDHFREYPTEVEFESGRYGKGPMAKYLHKVSGGNRKVFVDYYTSPPDAQIKYVRDTKSLSYKLYCPQPERYGLKALYFTSKSGLVQEGAKAAKATGIKAAKKPSAGWENVSKEDEQAIRDLLMELHEAYKNKDLDKVMEMEKEAIEKAALDAEARGKYTAEEVRDAFRGTAKDVFDAEGFEMEPFNAAAITFKKMGEKFEATSFMPIIATKRVTVGTMKVRLKISTFEMKKADGKMKITGMQMN